MLLKPMVAQWEALVTELCNVLNDYICLASSHPGLHSICKSSTPSTIPAMDECQVTKLYLLPSFYPVQIDEVFCDGVCSFPMWFLLLILIGCNCSCFQIFICSASNLSFFVLDLAFAVIVNKAGWRRAHSTNVAELISEVTIIWNNVIHTWSKMDLLSDT